MKTRSPYEFQHKIPYGRTERAHAAAGYVVMSGNRFDSAVMKISVIDPEFHRRVLSNPEHPDVLIGKAVVFEGPGITIDADERLEYRRTDQAIMPLAAAHAACIGLGGLSVHCW